VVYLAHIYYKYVVYLAHIYYKYVVYLAHIYYKYVVYLAHIYYKYIIIWGLGLWVFNAIFTNISDIAWHAVLT
jgi:hypothetical protein